MKYFVPPTTTAEKLDFPLELITCEVEFLSVLANLQSDKNYFVEVTAEQLRCIMDYAEILGITDGCVAVLGIDEIPYDPVWLGVASAFASTTIEAMREEQEFISHQHVDTAQPEQPAKAKRFARIERSAPSNVRLPKGEEEDDIAAE